MPCELCNEAPATTGSAHECCPEVQLCAPCHEHLLTRFTCPFCGQ